ncbi:Adenosine/AMP deaminase [Fragilaria crotonensis]|nr:Adenosine/AMP deaminase [Fragilaria crotonensis]
MPEKTSMEDFVRLMPKVELHLHLEGTMEPSLLLALAKKNQVEIEFNTIEEVQNAYNFSSLDEFLKLYYQGMDVLVEESDFYDIAWGYLTRVHEENVRHVEVFFDPQPHMQRGVTFETIVKGFSTALQAAESQFKMTSKLIMCFVRHLPVEDMFETLEASFPFRHLIAAVGLDSTELGNPPIKYKELFEKAREYGYECVAHAGEEGPPEYVTGSLDHLKVKRIDHGVRCAEDPDLVARLAKERIPLTVCPISNCRLCVFSSMKEHNLMKLLNEGVCVTINSDDPGYFGGYITDNFLAVVNEPALQVEREHVIKFVQNSIDATLLSQEEQGSLTQEFQEFCDNHPPM